MKPKRRPMIYTRGFRFDEISFEATREEKLLDWLRAKQRIWDKRDDNRRRELCRELLAKVRQDKILLELEAERVELQAAHDKRIADIKAWWEAEQEREAQAEDAKRRAALERITKHVERDKLRTERQVLLRRGVVRGRIQGR